MGNRKVCKGVYEEPSVGHKNHVLYTSTEGMPTLLPWVSFPLVRSLGSNKLGGVQCNITGSSCMGRVVQSLLKSSGNQFTPSSEQTHFQFLKTTAPILSASAILAARAPLENELQAPKSPGYFLATFFPHIIQFITKTWKVLMLTILIQYFKPWVASIQTRNEVLTISAMREAGMRGKWDPDCFLWVQKFSQAFSIILIYFCCSLPY